MYILSMFLCGKSAGTKLSLYLQYWYDVKAQCNIDFQ